MRSEKALFGWVLEFLVADDAIDIEYSILLLQLLSLFQRIDIPIPFFIETAEFDFEFVKIFKLTVYIIDCEFVIVDAHNVQQILA